MSHSNRPGVTNFVHIGLVVEDLDETVRFLTLLGFDCGEPGVFGGEWIDRIIGLENVTVETVMARAPDGSDMFEVVRFQSPSAGAQEPAPAANRPGLRHVAFKVDDVRGVVDRVREAGWQTVGEIVDFENTFLLCYVRGRAGHRSPASTACARGGSCVAGVLRASRRPSRTRASRACALRCAAAVTASPGAPRPPVSSST
jgi:catechol 2,3-dioxygenase-like lactoylglutathione lyase family enzyme